MSSLLSRTRTSLLGLVLLASAVPASAACPSRLTVAHGDTLSSIARACRVNVEALRNGNPGLTAETLRAGAIISVPKPPLPSRQIGIGRPSVEVAPSLVPPRVGPPATGSVPSTVIMAPQRPEVPPQHILRGFGEHPGQLPLPPGHVGTLPENLFPHQRY